MGAKGYKSEKIKVCTLCHTCQFNCKVVEPLGTCQFYKRGYNRFEYKREIEIQQVNLKKLCNTYNLKLNIMLDALRGRIEMPYKYRCALNSRLQELEEYLPYYKLFEVTDGKE